MSGDVGTPVPLWRRDFPYEAAAEEEVTRREFARYLVLGAGAMAAGNVGIAVWTQLRSINTGEPRSIVALADVPIGQPYLFRYPTDDDPAVLLRVADRELVAFSQKCTHLGCVVYYQAEQARDLGAADTVPRTHRRRGARRRADLGTGQDRVRAYR
jgi:Rieske Fe-S protein